MSQVWGYIPTELNMSSGILTACLFTTDKFPIVYLLLPLVSKADRLEIKKRHSRTADKNYHGS